MRALSLTSAALLTVACHTTPVSSSSARPVPANRIHAPEFTKPQQGFGFLVVTRDKGLKAKACTARLYMDGTLVADLRASEQIRLFVEEGEHRVGVTAQGCLGGSDQTSIVVARARPVLLRIAAGHGEGMTIEPSAF